MWDGGTIVVIFSTVILATLLMGIAMRREFAQRVAAGIGETEGFRYHLRWYENLCLFLSLSIVILVAGLQMSNSDYPVYKDLYRYEYSKNFNLLQPEFIFRTINKVVYDGLHEFQWILLIVSFITNVFMYNNIIYYSLKSKVPPEQTLFLYLSIYYLVSFGMLRQICAVSIILYSYRYAANKQYIRYLFFTLLAFGFHATAIVSIAIMLFCAIDIRSKKWEVVYRASVVAVFYLVAIFSKNILSLLGELLGRPNYIDYFTGERIGLGLLAYRVPILAFLFLFRQEIAKAPKYVKMFTHLLLFETLISFTYYLVPMLGGRFPYFTLLGYAIVIPYCLNSISKTRAVSLETRAASPIAACLCIYGYGVYYLLNLLRTTAWITEYLMPIHFFGF